ncbi:hypothetical protein B2G74_19980 [Burkholderia sp. A27]|nr:hypothetical protein B2G74_19980 [Burkholderia sp. A27]
MASTTFALMTSKSRANCVPTRSLYVQRSAGFAARTYTSMTTDPPGPPRNQIPTAAPRFPQILGHEFSREVLAVGNAVTSVSPGDRVSVQPRLVPAKTISDAAICLSLAEIPQSSV